MDALHEEASDIKATMRDLVMRIDGRNIDGLDEHTVGPSMFAQVIPPEPNYFSCNGYEGVSGLLDPLYLVGYFVLLPPGRPGQHRLEYGGTLSYLGWDFVNRVTATITVE